MARGRFAQPDALKDARGNPGKRAIKKRGEPQQDALDLGADAQAPKAAPEITAPADIDVPAFLTRPAEVAIFRKIIGEFMPAQIARETDFAAYGRYSVYLAKWCRAKELLEGEAGGDGWYQVVSKHGTRYARHPAAQDLLDYGTELTKLELQLGLTPLSRQSILRGLGALNGLGGLDAPRGAGKPADDGKPSASPAGREVSPLGFLRGEPKSVN